MISYRQLSPALISNDPGKSIAIALFVLMSMMCVMEIWHAVRFREPVVSHHIKAPTVTSQAAIDEQSPLFRLPLFGAYVPDLATAEIKQSTLDFTVVGIMYSDKKDESQVLLQSPEGKDQSFMVGDTLPGGAVIQRIEKSRIIVLYKGALESLRLPKNELLFEAPPKPLLEE